MPWVFHDIAMPREIAGDRMAGYRTAARSDAQQTPSWRYAPATGGAITHATRPRSGCTRSSGIWLARLQRGMSLFFTRSTFKHPTPEDFFSAINEGAGRDLKLVFRSGVSLVERIRLRGGHADHRKSAAPFITPR